MTRQMLVIKQIIVFCAGMALSIVILFFSSCENKTEENFNPKYFDLKNYFENEAAEMQQQKFLLKKSITKGNETESKIFNAVDWKSEFAPFMECDINRLPWLNSYRTDSSAVGENIFLKYTAIDSALSVKTIHILFKNNKPLSVQIIRKTDKQFFDHTTYLNFVAGKSYSIDDWQKINFAKSIRIRIEGFFIKKQS